ncbi:chromosomal replication initiator protein DnaA [uncultured Jatrophihabitans sp.]|uniref:chromosomal replication initiator protein DnaA n=1 Tax=uncultured Jatrophihabitans sp. TaxID=1610747 RepID=UPI0035C9CC90
MDDSVELATVWAKARHRFDDPSIRPQHKAWIGLTKPVGLFEDTALLAAPNDYARDYLENRVRSLIAAVLSEELGRDIHVAVTVQTPDPNADEPDGDRTGSGYDELTGENFGLDAAGLEDGEPPDDDGPDAAEFADDARTEYAGGIGRLNGSYRPRHHSDSEHDKEARLNPKYTFDTFVIGSSNRFTHAAAVAVAEAPARAYNPLFIYGDSGLGKTHLLHAIGHYARRLQPGLSTRYVSSEEFTNEFINSVRDDKMQAFQSRYRNVDVLLIDDIQFLERAERTQEEFFHTFNTLHNANKQIVISSDKSPRQLNSLEDRLRTRFEWGLISDVQAPDLETRIAILRKKAAQEGMDPPPDVLEFIATRIQSNIRELEGALIRVTAFAGLNQQAVELGLAERVLKDLVGESDAPEISATQIMVVTAEYFDVSIDDLTGSSRSRVLVGARQIAMYLCRELTDLSLPKVGEKFGNRDHTTVMHAERKIKAQMAERMTTYNQIAELTSRIKLRARS